MLLQRLIPCLLRPALLASCLLTILAAAVALAASPLSRDAEPVVVTGAQIPTLAGIAPDRIAAFRYETGTGWHAIPVQVDERAVVDLGVVYDSSPVGLAPLVYTDAGTFTGADPNTGFDSDDELVFMARDAGDRSVASAAPSGTIQASSTELVITDPLAPGETGYVYLFEHDGTLDLSAGQSYVSYTFDLLSGSYLATYDLGNGTNPENSTVVAPHYSSHFADRWIQDQLSVTAGAATGVDILDRDKTGVLPGNCGRTEDTFAQGGGAFIANKSGPVRAIRSYMGANSGPYTQRDHFFYDRIEEGVLFHRVHEIGSGFNTTDYSPAAGGMTYANNLNQGGVTIDGVPDTVGAGTIAWELATGPQGSVVRSFTTETTIAGLIDSTYYVDDTTPADDPCTGDDDALYGTSGPWWVGITCTDPVRPECAGTADDLRGFKRIYYEAPGLTVADAVAFDQEARTPLVVTVGGVVPTPVPTAPAAPLALLLLGVGVTWLARRRNRRGIDVRRKLALLLPLCLLLVSATSQSSTLDRDRDPVILTGLDLPRLLGLAPSAVVAFRHQGGWIQIPVQIDERDVVTFNQVYGGGYPQGDIDVETYTDPGTYVGADSNPLFDEDDELVFMAKDTGDAAPGGTSLPAGVVGGSGVQLAIHDSLDGGAGFVYLFESAGSLTPDAGADYVTYSFNLLAGIYPDDYNLANGPNPEMSGVVTPLYETEFTDRWIRPVTKVKAGAATGVDILDRHKNLFEPGNCIRSEETFSNGEGAFFANIDGPVRAIRSYMGANSGPLTQRRHIFYEGRQDVSTFLRVHAINGMLDVYDYSPAAIGMTYSNNLNTGGVTIDGVPDSVTPGLHTWQMVTGAQGTLIITGAIETDIAPLPTITSYYDDDDHKPTNKQCTGDNFEYGQSGLWITSGIPNTDPSNVPFNNFTGSRNVYYEEPYRTVGDAAARALQVATPLNVSASAFPFSTEVPALSPLALLCLAGLLVGLGVRLRSLLI